MTPLEERPSLRLHRLIDGNRVSQAIHVAATLGVADRLRDGPCGAPELAAALIVDAPALYRLLRALAAVGVFCEDDQGRFSLTEIGRLLVLRRARIPAGPRRLHRPAGGLGGVGAPARQRPVGPTRLPAAAPGAKHLGVARRTPRRKHLLQSRPARPNTARRHTPSWQRMTLGSSPRWPTLAVAAVPF